MITFPKAVIGIKGLGRPNHFKHCYYIFLRTFLSSLEPSLLFHSAKTPENPTKIDRNGQNKKINK